MSKKQSPQKYRKHTEEFKAEALKLADRIRNWKKWTDVRSKMEKRGLIYFLKGKRGQIYLLVCSFFLWIGVFLS
jgi:hypothetical protein